MINCNDLYFIEGQLSQQDLQQLALELLSDSVTQSASRMELPSALSKPKDGSVIVEVALRPGVTDPVAEQLVRAAHDQEPPQRHHLGIHPGTLAAAEAGVHEGDDLHLRKDVDEGDRDADDEDRGGGDDESDDADVGRGDAQDQVDEPGDDPEHEPGEPEQAEDDEPKEQIVADDKL